MINEKNLTMFIDEVQSKTAGVPYLVNSIFNDCHQSHLAGLNILENIPAFFQQFLSNPNAVVSFFRNDSQIFRIGV
jgi:hypothetical protein